MKNVRALSFVFLFSIVSNSCTNSDPSPIALSSVTYSNLKADPPSRGYAPDGTPLGVTKKFTLFSFRTGDIIANTDSATTKWDIGFNGVTIIVNGGKSGLGKTQAQLVKIEFNKLLTAPETGYFTDNDAAPIGEAPNMNLAIPTGSSDGWYSYEPTSKMYMPISNTIIVIKTTDERYAKMEIVNYYKEAPTNVSADTPDRHYTFKYVYQRDGTRNFN
jgi:hypothetical protein